jgi:hypothetical protein
MIIWAFVRSSSDSRFSVRKLQKSYDLTTRCAPLEISTLNLLRVDSDFRFPASALRWQGDLSEGRERGTVSAP